MILVYSAEKVWQDIPNGLWDELLSLSVKEETAADDLILALETKKQRMANRCDQGITSRTDRGLAHVLADARKSAQKIGQTIDVSIGADPYNIGYLDVPTEFNEYFGRASRSASRRPASDESRLASGF
jgi:hypothetical protein